jgi:hypothetical protein
MEPRHVSPTDRPEPTHRRLIGIVLGAGALAGAVVAIHSVWGLVVGEDAGDKVTITSVEQARQATLSDYAATHLSLDAQVEADSAEGDAAGAALPAHVAVVETTPSATQLVSSSAGATTAPATPSSSASPSLATPSPSPTRIDLGGVEELVRDPTLRTFVLPPAGVRRLMPPAEPIVKSTPGVSEAPDGDPVDALHDTLDGIESTTVGDQQDPLGVIVSVDFDIEGLKGEPLWLTWSLDGLNVPDRWTSDLFGYNVRATTDDDHGTVELWVPDLVAPGSYRVNVTISRASDGTPMDSGTPLAIEADATETS